MDNFNRYEKAVELYHTGMSLSRAAAEAGIPHETLRQRLKKQGVDTSLFRPSFITYNLDPLWFAEFRGLFYGEGCVYIHKRNAFLWDKTYSPVPVYRPDFRISLRDDDADLLQEVKSVLGGSLTLRKASGATRPSVSWQLVGFSAVYPLLESMASGLLPSKKRSQFETMIEFSKARFQMPEKRLSPHHVATLEAFYVRMKLLKSYTGG